MLVYRFQKLNHEMSKNYMASNKGVKQSKNDQSKKEANHSDADNMTLKQLANKWTRSGGNVNNEGVENSVMIRDSSTSASSFVVPQHESVLKYGLTLLDVDSLNLPSTSRYYY